MELCKTKCKDCGYVHVWYAFKRVNNEERREWNRIRSTTCQKCGSHNVVDVNDNEVMAPYHAAAEVVLKVAQQKAVDDLKKNFQEGTVT